MTTCAASARLLRGAAIPAAGTGGRSRLAMLGSELAYSSDRGLHGFGDGWWLSWRWLDGYIYWFMIVDWWNQLIITEPMVHHHIIGKWLYHYREQPWVYDWWLLDGNLGDGTTTMAHQLPALGTFPHPNSSGEAVGMHQISAVVGTLAIACNWNHTRPPSSSCLSTIYICNTSIQNWMILKWHLPNMEELWVSEMEPQSIHLRFGLGGH